jgi:spore germination cell wall hydrolase CwlJ-like protein
MLTIKRLILLLTILIATMAFILIGSQGAYSSTKSHKDTRKSSIKRSSKKSSKKHKLHKKVKRKKAKKRITKVKHNKVKSKKRLSYSKSDLDLLARLINAEAVGEPYKTKVAVGSVIINRVKSHQFASTVYKVIYQKIDGYYQFTPTLNGWINKPATADSKKAAYEAFNGSDPTKGALYYFDNSTTNSWLWSKIIKAKFGNMVFAY